MENDARHGPKGHLNSFGHYRRVDVVWDFKVPLGKAEDYENKNKENKVPVIIIENVYFNPNVSGMEVATVNSTKANYL